MRNVASKLCRNLSLLTLLPALACHVSCSSQKSMNESTSSVPTSAMDAEASPRDVDGESMRQEAQGMGPQGPQVLLGGPAKQLKLSTLPKDVTSIRGLLVAIDTPYQVFDNQGSYVHVAAWNMDGSPAKQADVFVGDTHMGTTSDDGSFVFLYPPRTDDTNASETSAPSGGMLTVVDSQTPTLQGSVAFQPNIRTASFASDHLFAYTDRDVYKPGDRVKMRLIGWHLEGDYAPLVEADIEILLRDPEGKPLGGATRTTDDYGVASLELPIPLTAPQGSYTLEVAYKQERQTARLQVRDFQPPAVLITHDLPRFLRKGDTQLDTSITLASSHGDSFGSGDLTLSVARAGGAQLFTTSQRVKGNGPHKLSISSQQLDDIKNAIQEGTSLQVTLEVEDRASNTKDSVVRDMRYVTNPYVAVLELDKDQYSTGDAVEIVAKIKDLDNVPIREQKVFLDLDDTTHEAITDASGTAQFSLTMPSSSKTVSLRIDGVVRPLATTSLNWVAPRAMVSHIADPIIKERQKAHVTVKFPADIVPAERFVHMDVVDTSGAIVNAVLLPIRETNEGIYAAEGDFDSPSWGSMLLTFFALGHHRKDAQKDARPSPATLGLMTEGQNLVVHPDRELTIVLDGVPDTIAPGSDLHIKAQVLDKQGYPTESTLGISVSDRRILSMKDPLEITPMDHFYDPTLRTMSTTGSKILSWPVVSRNWGGRTDDVALPPFPFLEGGGLVHHARTQGAGGAAYNTADGVMPEEEPSAESEPQPILKKMKKKSSKASGASSSFATKNAQLSQAKDSSPLSKMDRRTEEPGRATPETKPQITIRTRFPETSTWRPHVRTTGQIDDLALLLPDTIAEQEIIVVASDKRGAVGVTRQRLRVTQDLFAQAQFPTTLHTGETVLVPVLIRNESERAEDIDVSFISDSLHTTTPSRTLNLAPQSSTIAAFTITARGVGELPYKIELSSSDGSKRFDEMHGMILANTAGARDLQSQEGALQPTGKRGASFSTSFTVPASASAAGAWLTISPPTVTTALSALESLRDEVQTQPLLIASDLASAALILQYAQRRRFSSPQLDDLRQRVLGAMASLQIAQHDNGSFGYWRNGQPSPYITAWALEGMLEALQVDMPVPQESITRAASYLIDAHDAEGLVSNATLSFWEGDDKTVRLGLSAEIFDVLTRIPTSMQSDELRAFLKTQSQRFDAYVQDDDLDPLTTARALQGLMRLDALPHQDARAILTRLQRARDVQHWEPSWFHAYGGRVEATTAMLAAMTMADRDAFATEIRDALAWILSTRESWGAWHNERGTASALRALLLVAPEQGFDGTLVVKLDGKEIERVKLEADDPFMSAPQLAHVTLGTALTPGNHEVEVTFDGEPMRIPVKLFTQTVEDASAAPKKRAAHGNSLEVVSAPNKLDARNARTGSLTLAISLHEGHAPTTLHISRSALIEPDLAAWQELVDSSDDLLSWRITPHDIQFELADTLTSTRIALPYEVARRGAGFWPAISVTEHSTTKKHAPLVVSAGKLEIK